MLNRVRHCTCGHRNKCVDSGDVTAAVRFVGAGQSFSLYSRVPTAPLIGRFNVYNSLAALAAASALKIPLRDAVAAAHERDMMVVALTGLTGGALAGRVAIGLPPSLARVLTVPLTRAFRAQLPEASLSITEGLSAHMQEWLVTGRLDIAVLYNAQPSGDVELTPLHEEELLLVEARPAGLSQAEEPPAVVSLQAVAERPLVIPSRPNAVRMQVEAELANLGLRPQVALEIDGVSAILDLVADGAGAAVLSRNAVANSIKPSAYRLRSLQPALFSRLSLATSAARPNTLTQQATLALIQERLREITQTP